MAIPALDRASTRTLPERALWEPSYLRLERTGELAERARILNSMYRSCRLCPRLCGANRLEGQRGVCLSTSKIKVFEAHPHFGEERPLRGRMGSGTIFFARCSLRCVYCQNWEIAQTSGGNIVTPEALAHMMMDLQQRGCHNINLVTPTHFVPGIIQALRIAIRLGLRVPLVYNTGGYDLVNVLKLLEGVIDIYLPDFKYASSEAARKYSSGAKDYPGVAMAAIEEMHRQVGDLVVDADGIARRGLMIRHLVLPDNLAGTEKFVEFVTRRLGRSTYVNIMPQYRPAFDAGRFRELARPITPAEYEQAVSLARKAGLCCAGAE
jgi:putative pyruvate formate lyase activating enzyme